MIAPDEDEGRCAVCHHPKRDHEVGWPYPGCVGRGPCGCLDYSPAPAVDEHVDECGVCRTPLGAETSELHWGLCAACFAANAPAERPGVTLVEAADVDAPPSTAGNGLPTISVEHSGVAALLRRCDELEGDLSRAGAVSPLTPRISIATVRALLGGADNDNEDPR